MLEAVSLPVLASVTGMLRLSPGSAAPFPPPEPVPVHASATVCERW